MLNNIRKKRAFTLVEVVVALGILALVAVLINWSMAHLTKQQAPKQINHTKRQLVALLHNPQYAFAVVKVAPKEVQLKTKQNETYYLVYDRKRLVLKKQNAKTANRNGYLIVGQNISGLQCHYVPNKLTLNYRIDQVNVSQQFTLPQKR